MPFTEISPDIKLDAEEGPSYVELPANAKLDQETPSSDLWTGAEQTLKGVLGVGEAAGMFGSGLIGAGAAGVVGLRQILAGRPPEEVTQEMGRVGEALTYKPQTEAGKRFAGGLEWGMGKVAEAGKFAGETTQDILNKSQWTRPVANIGATAADVAVQTAAMAPLGLFKRAKPMIGPRELGVPRVDILPEETIPKLGPGPEAPRLLAAPPGVAGELPPGPAPREMIEVPPPPPDWVPGRPKTIREPATPSTAEGFKAPGQVFLNSKEGTIEVQWNPARKRYEAAPAPEIVNHEQMAIRNEDLRSLADPLLNGNGEQQAKALGKIKTLMDSGATADEITHNVNNELINIATENASKGGSIEAELNKAKDAGQKVIRAVNGIAEEPKKTATPPEKIISLKMDAEEPYTMPEKVKGWHQDFPTEPRPDLATALKDTTTGKIYTANNNRIPHPQLAEFLNRNAGIPYEHLESGWIKEGKYARTPAELAIKGRGLPPNSAFVRSEEGNIYRGNNHAEAYEKMSQANDTQKNIRDSGWVINGRLIKDSEVNHATLKKILSNESGFIELPKEKIQAAIDRFKEFWVPLSTLPHRQEILAARGKALGGVARVENIVNKAWTRLDKLPEQSKEDVFKAMSGQKDMLDLSPTDQHLARHFLNVNDIIGEMLVKRGILTVDQFNTHKGQYIRYMYLKHVLGEDAKIPTRPNGKLDLSYQKSRQDLTWEQRRALGIIENASIAEPLGMAKSLSDIVKYDYLEKIASDPRNVWEPSIVEIKDIPKEFTESGAKAQAILLSRLNGDKFSPVHMAKDRWIVWSQDTGTAVGRKMGIGELVKEVDIYKKMDREMPNTPEIQGRLNTLETALEKAKEATKNVPADFVQMPESKHWGPLAGAFVRKPIARDLMGFWGEEKGNIPGLKGAWEKMASLDEKVTGVFKTLKAPLNLPTAARNTVSNFLQLGMSGMHLWEIPEYTIKGIQQMINKTPEYGQAYRNGLFKTNWSVTELNEVMSTFRKMQGDKWGTVVGKVQDLARWYGKIDDLFKMAKYMEQRGKGMPVEKAVTEAQKWGMDYSLADPSVKWGRRHFIPFLSYQYKIAPLIAESLIKRPWIIGSLMALPYMVSEAAKSMNKDMTEEDWQELRKTIPIDLKERGTWMLVPVKTGGKWRWLDYSYMLPWGNYLQVGQAIKTGNVKNTVGQVGLWGTPMMNLAKTFAVNPLRDEPPKEPFSNQPIYNRLDPAYLKAAKTMEFFYNMMAPSMLTRFGALGYTASIGKEDRWGRKIDLQQAIPRWFGVNLQEANPKVSGVALKAQVNALRDEFIKIQSDPNISPERKDKYRQRLLEEINDLLKKRNQ